MTFVEPDSVVVYEVAICEHPLVVGEDDHRTDDELIAWVDERFEILDDALSWPDWIVVESGPPDAETLRYVNTNPRINVKMEYEQTDPFEAIVSRTRFDDECYPAIEYPELSCWAPTHVDDFDGPVHLDLTTPDQ